MRVLVLTYETPEYPGGGGASRMANLLEPLAARHEIRVVTTGGPPRLGQLPAGPSIRFLDPGPERVPDEPWLRKNLRHYLQGPPWLHWLARHHLEALAEALATEVAEFRPDVVEVEHGEIGALVAHVPRPAARVLVLHNLLSVVQWQQVGAPWGWSAVKQLLEVPVVAREERRHAHLADIVVTTTDHDRRLARRLLGRDPVVVPNCVRVEDLRRRRPRSAVPTVVFTASFHYPPNQRAADELIGEVVPRVRACIPEAVFLLAGQRLPDDLRMRAERTEGVEVISPLDDVRPVLERAWVAVAPLRQGSGSPLKVMEALAAGVPVVATPRVASALGIGPAAGMLVAPHSAATAEILVDLLGDRRRCEILGQRGADHAAAAFDHRQAAERLEQAWAAAHKVSMRH